MEDPVTTLNVPGSGEEGVVKQNRNRGDKRPCLQLITFPTGESERLMESIAKSDSIGKRDRYLSCCNCKCGVDNKNSKKLSEKITEEYFATSAKEAGRKSSRIADVFGDLFQFEICDEESSSWLMCLKCEKLLAKLFELYREFVAISLKSEAVLSKLFQKTEVTKSKFDGTTGRSRLCEGFIDANFPKKKIPIRSGVSVHKNKQKSKVLNLKKIKTRPSESTQVKESDARVNVKRNKKKEEDRETYELSDDTGLDASSDTCSRCGKHFKNFAGLKIHYAAHLRDDNKLECQDCGKKFRNEEALQLHVKIDHKGFKPHKCPHEGCDRSFRLKDKLRLHIKVIHEKNKPFPCPKCEKTFRTKYHLKAHDVAQHIQGDTSIGCSQCRRKFSSKEALEVHIKMHDEEKQFKCEKCDKGFKTSSRLKLHLKSHVNTPSAVCPTCGKAYKHIRDLRLHEVTHEGESSYRFACGDCPRKFYRIDLLRVHQSNEKHFSPEKIGPCVPKHVNNAKPIVCISIPIKRNDEQGGKEASKGRRNAVKRSQQKEPKVARKLKSEPYSKPKAKETFYDCFESASLFPTMVPMEASEYSSSGLEIMELSHSLTASLSSSSFRKTLPEPLEHNAFLLSNKDPDIHNLECAPSTSHYSLPSQIIGNTDGLHSVGEPDRNLSAFSISEGAQEVAYDVIRAYVNTL